MSLGNATQDAVPDAPARAAGTRTAGERARRLLASPFVLGLILPILLIVLWQIVAQTGTVPRNLLPAPMAVLTTIENLTVTGEIWRHIGITLYRVAAGFLWGLLAATIIGMLVGYSETAQRLLDPTLQALRNVPSIAWVPLFILWLGIFEASKITLIAVGVFFPIYLNLAAGIRGVDRKLVEVGRVYRLSGLALVWRVLLPAPLPSYMVGVRSGLGLGWMFVVAAELMGASEGLGFLLVDGQMTGRPQIIIAAILLFAICGKLTDMAVALLSTRVLRWQDSFKTA